MNTVFEFAFISLYLSISSPPKLAIFERSVSESGTGPLDSEAPDPVPDSETLLRGMAQGPVVCIAVVT